MGCPNPLRACFQKERPDRFEARAADMKLQYDTDEEKEFIPLLKLLGWGALFLHLVLSVMMLFMGFLENQPDASGSGHDFSITIVLCAFGGFISVLWAAVTLWEVHEGNSNAARKWHWYNRQFILSGVAASMMTLCVWPSMIIFVLHSIGEDFFEIIQNVSDLYGVLVFHIVASLLLGLVSVFVVPFTSRRLHLLSKSAHQEEERAQAEEDEDDSSEVDPVMRRVIGVVVLVNFVFLVDLVMVVSREINSGTFMCMLLHLAYFVYLLVVFRQELRSDLERDQNSQCDFLEKWRLLGLFQVFLTYMVYWVALLLVIVVDYYKEEGFFSILSKDMPGPKVALVVLCMLMFFLVMPCYSGILLLHNKCMSQLEEITNVEWLERGVFDDDGGEETVEVELVDH